MSDRFNKRVWSPELLAELRRRVEETDEPRERIAKAFDIPASTFRALIAARGWARQGPSGCNPEDTAPAATSAVAAAPAAAAPRRAGTLVERLERAVAKEITALERLRSAKKPRRTGSAADTERIVRSLERLTDTLAKVRRMREPAAADPDDDLPRDIDEFRRVLARRIEQLVRGRADGDAAGEPAGEEPRAPRR